MKDLVKSVLVVATLLAFSLAADHAGAGVSVHVGIALPPPVVFAAPPQLVVLPGTYVYAVPDYGEDIFFYDGWWWRPWHGHWYRSHYYDRDWGYYSSRTPAFYRQVPHDWRDQYGRHEWRGRPWNYESVSHEDVQRNWGTWKRERRWSKEGTHDVMRPGHPGHQPSHAPKGHAAPPSHRGGKTQEIHRGGGGHKQPSHGGGHPQQMHRQSQPSHGGGHSQQTHPSNRKSGGGHAQPSGGHGQQHGKH